MIGMLLDWRVYTKLKSTYVDALPLLLDPQTGVLIAVLDGTALTLRRTAAASALAASYLARSDSSVHLMVGTGYGLEQDWKHGMYQGPDLVVQGVGYDLSRPEDAARMWGMVDAVGRFDYDGHTGYGLYEYWALGDHPSFR